MRTRSFLFGALVGLGAVACSSSSSTSADVAATPPGAGAAPSEADALAALGDGSTASVDFVVVYDGGATAKLVDLGFVPGTTGDVWVLGADSMMHIGQGVDGATPKWLKRRDPAYVHFMYKPPAMAMGDGGFWATCGNNDNSQAARTPNMFTGPSLFTTDLEIFAERTPNGLGSHFDMLHNSPFCRGIAHVSANAYWAFNGNEGSLDRYDFHKDHGPGNDDHSDGEIFRYAQGQVKGDPDGETASHLFYDASDAFLYVADTGNQRIGRLDTTKGTRSGDLPRRNEILAAEGVMSGTVVEDVVPAGKLEKPCGLELAGDVILVTDAATSTFHAFDKTGKELRALDTGLPAGSLGGFVLGPDKKIWFTDRVTGRLLRIEPKKPPVSPG